VVLHQQAPQLMLIGVCRTFVFSAGLPGLVLWCLGVPAVFGLVLFRQRHRLHEERVLASLGFLFAGYKPRMYCWETVIMLRKLAVVAATTLVTSSQNSFMRLILCLGIIWISLLLQACSCWLHSGRYLWIWLDRDLQSASCGCQRAGRTVPAYSLAHCRLQIVLKPYSERILNRMELVSLVTASITIYLAAFYVVPFQFSKGFLTMVTVIMLCVNGAVMLWFAITIIRAGAKTILKQIGAMDAEEEQVRPLDCMSACIHAVGCLLTSLLGSTLLHASLRTARVEARGAGISTAVYRNFAACNHREVDGIANCVAVCVQLKLRHLKKAPSQALRQARLKLRLLRRWRNGAKGVHPAPPRRSRPSCASAAPRSAALSLSMPGALGDAARLREVRGSSARAAHDEGVRPGSASHESRCESTVALQPPPRLLPPGAQSKGESSAHLQGSPEGRRGLGHRGIECAASAGGTGELAVLGAAARPPEAEAPPAFVFTGGLTAAAAPAGESRAPRTHGSRRIVSRSRSPARSASPGPPVGSLQVAPDGEQQGHGSGPSAGQRAKRERG
jgi:hypothetical protein